VGNGHAEERPDGTTTKDAERPGAFKRAIRRITAHETDLDAEELREDVVDELGGTPVAACGERALVCVAGKIKSVTLKPVGGAPSLAAEVYDGVDTVTLVFLGRRSIPGIEPGRVLVAHGRLRRDDGRALIFNPKYELRPLGE
jgi:hypothetical protein